MNPAPPNTQAPDADTSAGGGLPAFLGILRRRMWVVLAAVVAGPVVAVLLSLQQDTIYQAQADALAQQRNLAQVVTGQVDANSTAVNFTADLVLQATREPVAQFVAARAGVPGLTGASALEKTTVTSADGSNVITFTVEDGDAETASRLASAYASLFSTYQVVQDRRTITKAKRLIRERLRGLTPPTTYDPNSLYAELSGQLQQLITYETLTTPSVVVLHTAGPAERIQPAPVRAGTLGLIAGIIVGLGLAFIIEVLDTRVRRPSEVTDAFGVPRLAGLTAPPKGMDDNNRLVVMTGPGTPAAEQFRLLRTNLDFVTLGRGIKSVMFTSAEEREGKSTTVANLAAAMALAGRRVALIDLDLRRPRVGDFFDLQGQPGVSDVVLGTTSLDEALAKFAPRSETAWSSAAIDAGQHGELAVLPAGTLPPNAGEIVGLNAIAAVIEQLKETYEMVLIDTPPLLAVGDALTLTQRVDGVVVVAHLGRARRPLLRELVRMLAVSPTTTLGVVITGAKKGGGAYSGAYTTGSYYGYGAKRPDAEQGA